MYFKIKISFKDYKQKLSLDLILDYLINDSINIKHLSQVNCELYLNNSFYR